MWKQYPSVIIQPGTAYVGLSHHSLVVGQLFLHDVQQDLLSPLSLLDLNNKMGYRHFFTTTYFRVLSAKLVYSSSNHHTGSDAQHTSKHTVVCTHYMPLYHRLWLCQDI